MYLSNARIDRRRRNFLPAAPYTYPYLYAIKFVECSSKMNEGVNEVFEHATRAALAYEEVKLQRHSVLCASGGGGCTVI